MTQAATYQEHMTEFAATAVGDVHGLSVSDAQTGEMFVVFSATSPRGHKSRAFRVITETQAINPMFDLSGSVESIDVTMETLDDITCAESEMNVIMACIFDHVMGPRHPEKMDA